MMTARQQAIEAIRKTGLDCANWPDESLGEIVDAVTGALVEPDERMRRAGAAIIDGPGRHGTSDLLVRVVFRAMLEAVR